MNDAIQTCRKFLGVKLMGRFLVTVMGCHLLAGCAQGEDASKNTAEQAWLEFLKAAEPSEPPKEWKQTSPTAHEIKQFFDQDIEKAEHAAVLAKVFQEKFSTHRKIKEAAFREYRLLAFASYFGHTNVHARMTELDRSLGKTKLDEEDRFVLESGAPARMESLFRTDSRIIDIEEVDKAVRKLTTQFPKYEESFAWLADLAKDYYSQDNFKKASALAQEILAANAPDSVAEDLKAMVTKINRVGKPLSIDSKAFDGRQVSLEKLRGKVVLIQGWATWCPICMEEMPVVKDAYKKLHSSGFEIVGLNFDSDKDLLSKFLSREKEVVWPHHFDGKGWNNKYGEEFEISALPVLWLVDKKGQLRELNAQNDLEGKVKKLLAE